MKRFLVAVFAMLLIFGLSEMNAQKKVYATNLIGGLAALSLPMGDFGDAANMGFGIHGVYQYLFQRNMGIEASLGYLTWGTDVDGASFSNIPILGAFIYKFVGSGNITPYIGGQLGINMLSVKVKVFNESVSDSDTKFGFAPFGGVEIQSESMIINLRGKLNFVEDANSFEINAGLMFPM